MSYQAYHVARLHGRDLVFLTRYLKEKRRNSGRRKTFVICNSYPKSGTHLLYQILYSLPGWERWDDIVSVQALCGIMNTPSHIRWKIGSAPDRSIIRSHLMYSKETREILTEYNCKVLFIYRDLRDVARSHARWVLKEKRIFLHDIYVNYLKDFDECLMASIRGLPLGTPFGSNVSQPDIGSDFSRWKGWVNDPETMAVRFEDLVGERGGGSEEKRLQTVTRILDYLGVERSSEDVFARFASQSMNPNESHTFRKGGGGKSGSWKTVFKPSHKETFKRVAGDMLIELGYEKDMSW